MPSAFSTDVESLGQEDRPDDDERRTDRTLPREGIPEESDRKQEHQYDAQPVQSATPTTGPCRNARK